MIGFNDLGKKFETAVINVKNFFINIFNRHRTDLSIVKTAASSIQLQVVDDSDSAIEYSGTWIHANDKYYYNSTKSYTYSKGSSIKLVFTGNNIKIFSKCAGNMGKFDVYIDDVYDSTVDLYSLTDKFKNLVYSKNLNAAPHTLYIRVASGLVNIDFFEYTIDSIPIPLKVETPTFTPPAGSYQHLINVTISSKTPGAKIYYTTDGTTPTTNSKIYSTPIIVSAATTIKAFAAAPGMVDSDIAMAKYILPGNALNIHYLDIGYGDCILIQTPAKKVMLIDGGKREDGNKIVAYIKALGIQKIDIILNTHAHSDHLGGLPQVMKSFPIGMLLVNSQIAYDYLHFLTPGINYPYSIIKAGSQLELDPSLQLDVLAPNSELSKYWDYNNTSIVVKITYGNTRFLFMADAVAQSENEMLAKSYDLKADVLKVAHHALWDSSSTRLLQAVVPAYGVISTSDPVKNLMSTVEPRNALPRILEANVKVYLTSVHGTVVFTSDGVTVKTDKTPLDIEP